MRRRLLNGSDISSITTFRVQYEIDLLRTLREDEIEELFKPSLVMGGESGPKTLFMFKGDEKVTVEFKRPFKVLSIELRGTSGWYFTLIYKDGTMEQMEYASRRITTNIMEKLNGIRFLGTGRTDVGVETILIEVEESPAQIAFEWNDLEWSKRKEMLEAIGEYTTYATSVWDDLPIIVRIKLFKKRCGRNG